MGRSWENHGEIIVVGPWIVLRKSLQGNGARFPPTLRPNIEVCVGFHENPILGRKLLECWPYMWKTRPFSHCRVAQQTLGEVMVGAAQIHHRPLPAKNMGKPYWGYRYFRKPAYIHLVNCWLWIGVAKRPFGYIKSGVKEAFRTFRSCTDQSGSCFAWPWLTMVKHHPLWDFCEPHMDHPFGGTSIYGNPHMCTYTPSVLLNSIPRWTNSWFPAFPASQSQPSPALSAQHQLVASVVIINGNLRHIIGDSMVIAWCWIVLIPLRYFDFTGGKGKI